MYAHIIGLMDGSSMAAMDSSRCQLEESRMDFGCYQRSESRRKIRRNWDKSRNSDFTKFCRHYQPSSDMDVMDWTRSFPREFVSPESSISNLCDNWNNKEPHSKQGHVKPVQTYSFEGWDMTEDEEEVHLPRQFLPQGLDWDYKFEESDYGRDVVVVSESEPSIDNMAVGSTSVSEKLANAKLAKATVASSSFQQLPSGREIQPRNISLQHKSSSVRVGDKKDEDKKKKLVEQQLPDSFLSVMEDIRDRAKSMTVKQVQLLNAQRILNNEVRKKAPRFSEDSWDVEDEQPNELMRRGTLHNFSLSMPRRSTAMGEKLLELKRVTRELGTLDLRTHIVLSDTDMKGFCYINYNNTRDLVLQGKEVFQRTGRRVQDFDLPYIFTFLVANPDVVYLDLSYNKITNTGAWYIMDFLSWNVSLSGLNLMNNDIDALDSHMIDALCENTSLKSLRMNGNPLGKKGGEYIAFLLMFKELEHLDLGQTDQTIESLSWISQALMQSETLKVLDLSRVLGYQGYVSDNLHFALAFSDILRLHLGKNGLSDVELEQILFGLSFNRRLELLDLACNRIGDLGAEMLAGALRFGAPLKALVLNTNMIGSLGARALSLKLPMSQIKFLDIAKNRIGDQGIIDIVLTIRKPYPLLALFIFGNNFAGLALEAVQSLILTNDLNPESLDITIFYWEGAIGHGHNPAADRYRPRYYKVPVNTKTERVMQKVKEHKPCRPGCLDYKFHNVVNVCGFQRHVASNNLGPSCPV